MSPSYLGAIWFFGGNFKPRGFSFCDATLIAISQNDALYNLLGTTFGGDGQNTFALPDLRGRVAIGMGQGPGLSNYVMGAISGTENVTLTSNTMPAHIHLINASSVAATLQTPVANNYLGQIVAGTDPETVYTTNAGNVTMAGSSIGFSGSSLPVSIIQPILAGSYVIALEGIYPSQ